MKKIIGVLFVIFIFISCSREIYNSSSWQSKKFIADGNLTEWPNPLRFYDQESGINYSISNDHNNMYFCCNISNEFMQMKILRSGLEFGIDTLGKKSFSVSIKYPAGILPENQPRTKTNAEPRTGPSQKPDRSAFKLKLLSEATEIQLTGFKPALGKIIYLPDPNKTGLSAAISFDANGTMNYESVIPFSTFYKNKLAPSDSNKVFNFRIKINPVADSNNSPGNGNGMRGGGSRSGGMGGGGMRGGGMRGGNMGGGDMGGGMGGGRGMRGGGMNGGRMSGGNGYQSNANSLTKTTIKLKLAYR